MGYRHGLDTLTLLALRNLLALPCFLVGVCWSEIRCRQKSGDRSASGRPVVLRAGDFVRIAGLGFVGYYLSSLVNFFGLQHISVGLERMILYTYPSLVMLGSALFLHKPLRRKAVLAMLVAYLGLALGFAAEIHVGPQGNLVLGASLVFCSAVTYAIFTACSGQWVRRFGPVRLMSWVLLASSIMVLIHFSLSHSWQIFGQLSPQAWSLGLALAGLGTVLPSYLFGWGLHRAGASATAVIGMVGPPGTLVLAWWLLGEPITAWQVLGLSLTMAGGLAMSLQKTSPQGLTDEKRASEGSEI